MGGNALASYGARRYDRAEYKDISTRVLSILWPIVPEEIALEIPSYKNKQSFGDMDILVQAPWYEKDYTAIIQAFSKHNGHGSDRAKFVRNNGPEANTGIISILFEELQVDIIPMLEEDLSTAHMYYSYNDLGNLMGKIFHKFGLKYGHRGLTYPMKDGDNQYDEIMVSKDGEEIFSFLGLNYSKFCQGFDELEDIFKYVMSSRHFSPEPFQYENLNHTNRIRDRKRSTYRGFLEYIQNNPCKATHVYNEDKSTYIIPISMHFPGFREKYKESLKKLEHRLQIKGHFNGELASEWTGLSGMRLGKFMAFLKFHRGEFTKWVLDYKQEMLKEIILDEAQNFWDHERISSLDLPKRNFRDDNSRN